jgi:hypothetical protein
LVEGGLGALVLHVRPAVRESLQAFPFKGGHSSNTSRDRVKESVGSSADKGRAEFCWSDPWLELGVDTLVEGGTVKENRPVSSASRAGGNSFVQLAARHKIPAYAFFVK